MTFQEREVVVKLGGGDYTKTTAPDYESYPEILQSRYRQCGNLLLDDEDEYCKECL